MFHFSVSEIVMLPTEAFSWYLQNQKEGPVLQNMLSSMSTLEWIVSFMCQDTKSDQ